MIYFCDRSGTLLLLRSAGAGAPQKQLQWRDGSHLDFWQILTAGEPSARAQANSNMGCFLPLTMRKRLRIIEAWNVSLKLFSKPSSTSAMSKPALMRLPLFAGPMASRFALPAVTESTTTLRLRSAGSAANAGSNSPSRSAPFLKTARFHSQSGYSRCG